MAQVATPTSLEEVFSTFSATMVSSSLSPDGDALIVIPLSWRQGVDRTLSSITSGFSTGTWTIEVASDAFGDDPSNTRCAIAWAITDSSPGSGTVTATFSAAVAASMMDVMQVASDFDTTTPIAQSKTTGETSPSDGTLTDTFDSTPNDNSMLICTGAGYSLSSTINGDTGWTKLNAQTTGNLGWGSFYADGSNGTGYGIVLGATPDQALTIAAVEVQEVQGGGGSIAPQAHYYYNMQLS